MIRRAIERDIPALRELWKILFNDSDDYLDLYFNHRFCAEHTAVLESDNELIGMIHLLPLMLSPNQKALYWYAAGIHPKHRKKGHFKKLATEIKKRANDMGYANLCVPAAGLEPFYRSIGFYHSYRAIERKIALAGHVDPSVTLRAAAPEDFIGLITPTGSTVWSKSDVEYAFLENEFCGGKQLVLTVDGIDYPFFSIKKDSFIIDYCNLSDELLDRCAETILRYLHVSEATVRQRCRADAQCSLTVGMSDFGLADSNSEITMTLY